MVSDKLGIFSELFMWLPRKLLALVGVLFALGVVAIIAAGYFILSELKEQWSLLQNVILPGEGDIQVTGYSMEDLDFHWPLGFGLVGVQCDAVVGEANDTVRITAEYLGSHWREPPNGMVAILARNLRLTSDNPDSSLLSERYRMRHIEVDAMEYETPASLFDLQGSLRRVYHDFRDVIQRGETTSSIRLQGRMLFEVSVADGTIQVQQRFGAQTSDGMSRIVLNRDDLEQVGPKFADRLSSGDLDLVAKYPLKAPKLFEIRRQTEEKTRDLRWSGTDFPEDAYRHVLWSYLLTLEYGPEFAQVVTDAHEVGSYNTPEESAKDHQNNKVGIQYALEGVSEDQILAKMLSDPRIRR